MGDPGLQVRAAEKEKKVGINFPFLPHFHVSSLTGTELNLWTLILDCRYQIKHIVNLFRTKF